MPSTSQTKAVQLHQRTLPQMLQPSGAQEQVNEDTKAANETSSDTKRCDVILPMQEPYMQQIAKGDKTYDFRKYRLDKDAKRIWFYRTAPYSSLDYICEIAEARTRGAGEPPLEEAGLGNIEYNTWHRDWTGYDFAYKVLSCYKIRKPIPLTDLKTVYGMKSAPRGLVYTPRSILDAVVWSEQDKLI